MASENRYESGYVQRLNQRWDSCAAKGLVGYNNKGLETKVLDPQDGRLPFFLVFNEGRKRYIEKLAEKKDDTPCPFCSSDFEELRIDDLAVLRVLANKFPCLPHQYLLTPKQHIGSLEIQYIDDAISFAKKTGFKVYYNAMGTGGSVSHFHFQASGKHQAAPKTDFFDWVKAQ